MPSEEKSILDSLDRVLAAEDVRSMLDPVVRRVRGLLADRDEAVMEWEPIPLSAFATSLPPQIRSAWIFILRGGANTGPERHPNSHQRMMSFIGSGDLQTREGADQSWTSNILVSDKSKPLEQRWMSIPRNVWHQPVIPPGEDWVVVSFHTVPAEELIEERPAVSGDMGMRQMRYVNR
jgi:hypothetical protein